jgi:hypothetical protein
MTSTSYSKQNRERLEEKETGGQLTEFHLTESVDRKFLII